MFSFSIQVGRTTFTAGQTEMVYVYYFLFFFLPINSESLEVMMPSKSFFLLDVFWNLKDIINLQLFVYYSTIKMFFLFITEVQRKHWVTSPMSPGQCMSSWSKQTFCGWVGFVQSVFWFGLFVCFFLFGSLWVFSPFKFKVWGRSVHGVYDNVGHVKFLYL